jgi:hypothetical protein
MCIFSQLVEHVAGTRIFARMQGDEQLLAYEMSFAAIGELAMVLPLPVQPGQGEAAARFVDLSGYPEFFQNLSQLFPTNEPIAGSLGRAVPPQTLAVHQVGAFEASYVPAVADFGRLDPRFQLSRAVWDELPQYRDYGFAVFKLRGSSFGLLERIFRPQGAKSQKVHPMALAFRTRKKDELFFPTVHVHDGRVQPEAWFDHELYCQHDYEPDRSAGAWECAVGEIRYDRAERSAGLLAVTTPCFRLRLNGPLPNDDVRIKASERLVAESPPEPTAARPAEHPEALCFRSWRPALFGPIMRWDFVVQSLLEWRLSELRELHERYVGGWIGWTRIALELDGNGRGVALEVTTDFDCPELIAGVRQALHDFSIPTPGDGRQGRIEWLCGFDYPPEPRFRNSFMP